MLNQTPSIPASRNAEEVYNRYIAEYGYDGDGDPNAIGLFSYALVERDKYEWISHFRAQNGNSDPTTSDIEHWFLSKPQSYFKEKSERAHLWYTEFSRGLLKDEMDEAKLAAVSHYIGDKLRFWPQVGVAIVANFMFLVIVGAIAAYVLADFSPVA